MWVVMGLEGWPHLLEAIPALVQTKWQEADRVI